MDDHAHLGEVLPDHRVRRRRRHRGDHRLRRLALDTRHRRRSASSPRSCCTCSSLFEPINQLSQLYNTVQSAGAALQKIFGVLDTRPTIVERPGAVDLPRRGEIDVDDVTFAYGTNEPVLHDVTLHIAAGRTARARRPDRRGQVDARQADRALLRPGRGRGARRRRRPARRDVRARCASAIVVVPQEGFLFAGSLRDNVRVGRPEATDAEVETALERARAARTVPRVPRRPRHRGARARLAAVGRGAPAGLARPRRAGRSVGARARRGDVEPRPRHRAPRSSRRWRR